MYTLSVLSRTVICAKKGKINLMHSNVNTVLTRALSNVSLKNNH